MRIQYLGHSCFKISSGGYALVVDPYENGSVPGLKNLDTTANLCVFSHEHSDHHGEGSVIMEESFLPCPFRIETIDSWHDDRNGSLRGRNRIHIFHVEKMKVVHLGDMGCAPLEWQMDLLKGADLVMAPAGGLLYGGTLRCLRGCEENRPSCGDPHALSDGEKRFSGAQDL